MKALQRKPVRSLRWQRGTELGPTSRGRHLGCQRGWPKCQVSHTHLIASTPSLSSLPPPRPALRSFPRTPSRKRAPKPNCRIRSLRGILCLHLASSSSPSFRRPSRFDPWIFRCPFGAILSHLRGSFEGLCCRFLFRGTKICRVFRKLQKVWGVLCNLSFRSLNFRWILRILGAFIDLFKFLFGSHFWAIFESRRSVSFTSRSDQLQRIIEVFVKDILRFCNRWVWERFENEPGIFEEFGRGRCCSWEVLRGDLEGLGIWVRRVVGVGLYRWGWLGGSNSCGTIHSSGVGFLVTAFLSGGFSVLF